MDSDRSSPFRTRCSDPMDLKPSQRLPWISSLESVRPSALSPTTLTDEARSTILLTPAGTVANETRPCLNGRAFVITACSLP